MAFKIKNRGTDALARKGARIKGTGLTEAAHSTLAHEHEQAKPSLVDIGIEFCRSLRAKGSPKPGRPIDRDYRDSLYERD